MGKRKATEEPNPAESAGGRKNHKTSALPDIIWAANDYGLIWKLLTEVPQYRIKDINSHCLLMNVHTGHLDGECAIRYQRAAITDQWDGSRALQVLEFCFFSNQKQ